MRASPTRATLRLTPLPEAVATLLAAFRSVGEACEAVRRIVASGLEPSALEILDRLTIEAVEASVYAAGYPKEAGAVLLVEFDGRTTAVEESAARVTALFRELDLLSLEQARDEQQRARLWKGRKGAFGAMGRMGPDLYVQDAVVPRSRVVAGLEDAFALVRSERGELPRATNIISGPSRTGDIEQTIVLGAHGPYRVHVILVEQA